MRGVTELAFVADGGGHTRLKHLYQRAPARVLMPDGADAGVPVAVLLNTGGGLVGGDRLDIRVSAAAGARAVVTQQAAEKVYRAPDAASRIDVRLSVGAGGWLEWLPQETILFNGAQLRRSGVAEVAAGGRLLAGEVLVFGRRARGETFARGLIEERWEIRRDGRPVWADALRLDGDLARTLAAAGGLFGAAAIASTLLVDDHVSGHLDAARQWLAQACTDGVQAAATVVGGVLITRWLAADPLPLRSSFARYWSELRRRIGGLNGALPRVWWS
ncbi:MAG: urease accessory protein UreD [Rhodospirillales bacterium]|jgi:urease accessory protein|nr:urease accessory protein UreD [Rhodospirillales bacterium]